MMILQRLLIAGVLMVANVGADAQGVQERSEPLEQEGQTPPPATFAGFIVPRLEGDLYLMFNESANGVMYGVDIYRKGNDASHRYADITPFVRFSQMIAPLAEVGTVEDLQTAVVNDAKQIMESNGLNDSLGETRPCERVIMGEVRGGQRFDAVLSNDPRMAPDPVKGHVECYAFEHEGKGIAVILKVAESEERASTDDARHVETLTASVVFRPVNPLSTYDFNMAGYPVDLPVGSRVMSMEQANETTMTARVMLDSVSLNLMLMSVPEQYAPENSFVQVERSYEDQIRASVAKSNGELRLLWTSRSALPAGKDRGGLIEAPVYMLSGKGGLVYSAMYKNLDGKMLLTGVFTASPANADKLHADAQAFVDAFRGTRYDLGTDASTVYLPSQRITLNQSLLAVALRDDSGEIDATLITTGPAINAKSVLQSLLTHNAFTAVRSAPGGDENDLERWHERFIDRVLALGQGVAQAEVTQSSHEFVQARGWVTSTIPLKITSAGVDGDSADADQTLSVVISSRVMGGDGKHPGMILSVLSPAVMASDARSVGDQLGDMIKPVSSPGRLGMGFGELDYDPTSMLVTHEKNELRHEEHTWFKLGDDLVDVFTTDPDSKLSVLSDRLLADRYVRSQWNILAYDDEEGLFPKKGEELDGVTIAGHEGMGLALRLPGSDEDPSRKRAQPIGAGVFGFRHGDQYTTIVIKQLGAFRQDRFDEILGMFSDGQ